MVTDLSVKDIKPDELCLDVLPRLTRRVFLYATELELFSAYDWYLAGGTALSLHVGHRQSVDLDFFTPRKSAPMREVARQLIETGKWVTRFEDKGTLYGTLMGGKMSLIVYPFFLPSRERLRCGSVQLLLPHDIAAMKIIAISQRGRKRDFVDLYWHCTNREPLDAVVTRAIRQYPGQEENLHHILKSLSYFDDAEEDPMPKLLFNANWRSVKMFFRDEVKRLIKNKFFSTQS